ncbi:protein BIC1 [Phalaenopsis equestris]|uniref:protein BIC1 n=1 Tax=Phalaenopsis equestris TaxID=78828 RepID=UPI0009E19AE4|nr:protein BIC1 [Phalaenopsis equestris]
MLNNQSCVNSTNQNQSQEKEETGPERLNRLRSEMAGKVWIPETWGQEGLLKEWSDCTAFDRSMVPEGLLSARRALMAEYRKTDSAGLRIENRCS